MEEPIGVNPPNPTGHDIDNENPLNPSERTQSGGLTVEREGASRSRQLLTPPGTLAPDASRRQVLEGFSSAGRFVGRRG